MPINELEMSDTCRAIKAGQMVRYRCEPYASPSEMRKHCSLLYHHKQHYYTTDAVTRDRASIKTADISWCLARSVFTDPYGPGMPSGGAPAQIRVSVRVGGRGAWRS